MRPSSIQPETTRLPTQQTGSLFGLCSRIVSFCVREQWVIEAAMHRGERRRSKTLDCHSKSTTVIFKVPKFRCRYTYGSENTNAQVWSPNSIGVLILSHSIIKYYIRFDVLKSIPMFETASPTTSSDVLDNLVYRPRRRCQCQAHVKSGEAKM